MPTQTERRTLELRAVTSRDLTPQSFYDYVLFHVASYRSGCKTIDAFMKSVASKMLVNNF